MASKPVVKGIKGKHLLVVNTGNRKKRFTLKRLHEMGCRLVILHAEVNWAKAYTEHWILADTNDHTASLRAIFFYAVLVGTLVPVAQNLLAFVDRVVSTDLKEEPC